MTTLELPPYQLPVKPQTRKSARHPPRNSRTTNRDLPGYDVILYVGYLLCIISSFDSKSAIFCVGQKQNVVSMCGSINETVIKCSKQL